MISGSRKTPGKSLSRRMADHPGTTLALLITGVGGAGVYIGDVHSDIQHEETARATQLEIVDLKNQLHKTEMDLIDARFALEQHDSSPSDTGIEPPLAINTNPKE